MDTRTRTKTRPKSKWSTTRLITKISNGVPVSGPTTLVLSSSASESATTESITDSLTDMGNLYTKPVTHTSNWEWRSCPDRYDLATINSGQWMLTSCEHLYLLCNESFWTLAPTLPVLSSVSAAYRQRAFEACLPRMNEGLSLVNFLLELKDLRRLFDGFFVRLSNLKSVTGVSWRELFKANAKSTLSEFARVFNRRRGESVSDYTKRILKGVLDESAENLLNYSFGWRPFLSDISQIWNSLKTFRKNLKYLKAHEGKILKRHYRRKLPGYDGTTVLRHAYLLRNYESWMAAYAPTDSSTLDVYESLRWVAPPTYHATLTYRYSVPNVDAISAQVAGFLDVLGVNFNPSIVWNALPFTFVVDWMVDVSGFLNRFRIDNLQIKTEVLDFSHSLKSHALLQMRSVVFSNSLNKQFKTTVCEREMTRYERAQTSQAASSIGVRLPGVWPVVLGTALGLTLHNRHNRISVKNKGGVSD